MSKLKSCLNIEDLREQSKRILPRGVFEYMDFGSEDLVALNNNREAFKNIKLFSRVMTDVSAINLKKTLFGKELTLPLAVAPTAISGLCWHEGEIALAKAAREAGVPFILSTNSITPLEKVASEAGGNLWFQLYMWRERELSYRLVERARASGYNTLVLSADFGRGSLREKIKRHGFSVPYRISARSVFDMLTHPRWFVTVMLRYLMSTGMPRNENFPEEYKAKITADPSARSALRADSLHWGDLQELRKRWNGPLLLKGITHPDDARLALKYGADGVVISNHGGRNLDSSVAPIDALPLIMDAVGGKMTVILDSGIRRGSDIAKALAIGADAALVGRAPLYGITVGGQEGALHAIKLLANELEKTMAFLGCRNVDELNSSLLFKKISEHD